MKINQTERRAFKKLQEMDILVDETEFRKWCDTREKLEHETVTQIVELWFAREGLIQ